MKPNIRPDIARQGDTADQTSDLEKKGAVKRSASGQLSVSLVDVSQTASFQRNLTALGRIRRQLTKAAAAR
jgi:hypothetical protein